MFPNTKICHVLMFLITSPKIQRTACHEAPLYDVRNLRNLLFFGRFRRFTHIFYSDSIVISTRRFCFRSSRARFCTSSAVTCSTSFV